MTAHHQANPFEFSEAYTCREYVTPAIQAAGWGDSPFEITEQPNELCDSLHKEIT